MDTSTLALTMWANPNLDLGRFLKPWIGFNYFQQISQVDILEMVEVNYTHQKMFLLASFANFEMTRGSRGNANISF